MKKALRIILWLLLIIVAIFVILGLVGPKEATVQRSIVINAPKAVVFEQIRYFKNSNKWSPWMEMDPNIKVEYKGTDGQEGASYVWSGNDKVGEGEMTNTGVSDGTMNYTVHFIKPFESTSAGYMKAEDTAGMTKVTWSMTMPIAFPMRAMCVMMGGMDKMIGKDFEKGLTKLKTLVESNPTATSSIDIKEVDFPAHTYAGVRKVIHFNEMEKFFADSYAMLGEEVRPVGSAAGLYYSWDEKNGTSDAVAAFPVTDTNKKIQGVWYTYIPASKAYMTVHKGGYAASMNAHMALNQKVTADGKKQSVVIEEYIVGPGEQKDSTQWVTNIYYVLQ